MFRPIQPEGIECRVDLGFVNPVDVHTPFVIHIGNNCFSLFPCEDLQTKYRIVTKGHRAVSFRIQEYRPTRFSNNDARLDRNLNR